MWLGSGRFVCCIIVQITPLIWKETQLQPETLSDFGVAWQCSGRAADCRADLTTDLSGTLSTLSQHGVNCSHRPFDHLSLFEAKIGSILEAPGEPRIPTRHGCFVTRGRCEEMPGEQPAGTGRVVLVKKIVMRDGATVGGWPAILFIIYCSYDL